MKTIYKTIKYGIKSNQLEILSTLNTKNCNNIYNFLKSNYIKKCVQIGGSLVDSTLEQSIELSHVVFHGSMANDRIMLIPTDMFVFMPLCCGFTVGNSLDEFNFFDEDDKEIITKLNTTETNSLISVGKKKYIVLKPNEEYCDIEIEYNIDLVLEEGIFSNDKKRLLNDMIIRNLKDIIENDQLHTLIVTNENVNLLKTILLNIYKKIEIDNSKQQDREEDIDEILEATNKKNMEVDFLVQTYNRDIFFINVCKNEIQLKINTFYLNSYYSFEDELKEIEKTIEFPEDIKTQLKLVSNLNINDKNFIDEFVKFVEFLIIILESHRENDVFVIKTQFAIQSFRKKLKEFSVDDIILELGEYYNIRENFVKFVSGLDETVINWKHDNHNLHYIDFTYTNVMFVSQYNRLSNHQIKLTQEYSFFLIRIAIIIAKLCKVGRMSEYEKNFFKSKYSGTPTGTIKIYLSDILNYIRETKSGLHFVVNKSCQGFQEDSDTCTVNKCFQQIISKTHNPTHVLFSEVFNQQDLKKIAIVLNKIVEMTEYSSINDFNKLNKKMFFDLQCILHAIKLEDPDVIAKVFLYYANLTYPHIIDSLHYSFENEKQSNPIWKSTQIKVIIAVLNLFITDVYNKNKKNQELVMFIKENMGELKIE